MKIRAAIKFILRLPCFVPVPDYVLRLEHVRKNQKSIISFGFITLHRDLVARFTFFDHPTVNGTKPHGADDLDESTRATYMLFAICHIIFKPRPIWFRPIQPEAWFCGFQHNPKPSVNINDFDWKWSFTHV